MTQIDILFAFMSMLIMFFQDAPGWSYTLVAVVFTRSSKIEAMAGPTEVVRGMRGKENRKIII